MCSYSVERIFYKDAAEHFLGNDEKQDKTNDELLAEALAACPDDKLTGFLLRLIFTEHISVPLADQTDWLIKPGPSSPPPDLMYSKAAARNVRSGQTVIEQTAVKKKVATWSSLRNGLETPEAVSFFREKTASASPGLLSRLGPSAARQRQYQGCY